VLTYSGSMADTDIPVSTACQHTAARSTTVKPIKSAVSARVASSPDTPGAVLDCQTS